MKLPSKELMGEVLLNTEEEEICIYELCCGRTIRYSIRFKCRNNDGTFNYEDDDINIYELAHKCKEWAFSKDHELVEEIGRIVIKDNNGNYLNAIHGPLDKLYSVERCFKACEWIMEQTKCGS